MKSQEERYLRIWLNFNYISINIRIIEVSYYSIQFNSDVSEIFDITHNG